MDQNTIDKIVLLDAERREMKLWMRKVRRGDLTLKIGDWESIHESVHRECKEAVLSEMKRRVIDAELKRMCHYSKRVLRRVLSLDRSIEDAHDVHLHLAKNRPIGVCSFFFSEEMPIGVRDLCVDAIRHAMDRVLGDARKKLEKI